MYALNIFFLILLLKQESPKILPPTAQNHISDKLEEIILMEKDDIHECLDIYYYDFNHSGQQEIE